MFSEVDTFHIIHLSTVNMVQELGIIAFVGYYLRNLDKLVTCCIKNSSHINCVFDFFGFMEIRF